MLASRASVGRLGHSYLAEHFRYSVSCTLVQPVWSEGYTMMTDYEAAARANLPENMADYFLRQRQRIEVIGRKSGLVGAQASWLAIVEHLLSALPQTPRRMLEVGVEGDRFHWHEENEWCHMAGCVPG